MCECEPRLQGLPRVQAPTPPELPAQLRIRTLQAFATPLLQDVLARSCGRCRPSQADHRAATFGDQAPHPCPRSGRARLASSTRCSRRSSSCGPKPPSASKPACHASWRVLITGGGLATWIVEGKRPVAVLAQQWSEARWLVDSEVHVTALRRETGRANFEVRYWCQVNPERVYACLRAGEPLPNRYGC